MILKKLILVIIFITTNCLFAQLKVGDSPDKIDDASLIELESRDKALVLTRVNSALMQKVKPLAGAMVYNTDASCIFYYNGNQWTSLCKKTAGEGLSFTEIKMGLLQ